KPRKGRFHIEEQLFAWVLEDAIAAIASVACNVEEAPVRGRRHVMMAGRQVDHLFGQTVHRHLHYAAILRAADIEFSRVHELAIPRHTSRRNLTKGSLIPPHQLTLMIDDVSVGSTLPHPRGRDDETRLNRRRTTSRLNRGVGDTTAP